MARTSNIAGDRREQIIDAALQVFAKKGFAQATNREIAREVGNMVFFAYPPETVYSFRGDMQKKPKSTIPSRVFRASHLLPACFPFSFRSSVLSLT